jgi:hypothetical protein
MGNIRILGERINKKVCEPGSPNIVSPISGSQ